MTAHGFLKMADLFTNNFNKIQKPSAILPVLEGVNNVNNLHPITVLFIPFVCM